MKNWYCLFLFLCLTSALQSQNAQTVLEALKSKKILELEWVHQRYSSERTSFSDDYPMFPDKLKEGEGESFVGLKFEMVDCDNPPCQVKVWVQYVSSVTFPDRQSFDPNINIYQPTTPPNASLLPKIMDTRYLSYDNTNPSFSLGSLKTTPLLLDIENGLIDASWVGYNVVSESFPPSFSFYYLETFLNNLWGQKWLEKEHYQVAKKEQQFGKQSYHFFRPKLPPKTTIITGKILSPVTNEVDINGLKEGSWLESWDREILKLDSTDQFRIEVKLDEPSQFVLSHGFNALVLYVEPGDSLHIEVDANAFYRKTTFSGDATLTNQFLLDFFHQVRKDEIFHGLEQNLLEQSQLAYFESALIKLEKELAFIESYQEELAPTFIKNFTQSILLENLDQLCYNILFFYKNKDAKIEHEVVEWILQSRKYFFRLPEDKMHDFKLESYLEFHQTLLKGSFTSQKFPLRAFRNYDFAKLIFSTQNVHRLGRLYLFLNRGTSESGAYDKLYSEVRDLCKDEEELKELEDYKKPISRSNQRPEFHRFLPVDKLAPKWSFANENNDTIHSVDYRDQYLLLHFGLAENLSQALSDIIALKKESPQNIKAISIVTEPENDGKKLKQKDIIYLSFQEMKTMRDSYFIDNNANHYFIIGPEGKIRSNSYFTSSFSKLKSEIKKLPSEKQEPFFKPTEFFWRNLGIGSLLLLLISGVYIQRKRMLAKREQQRRQLLELELKGIRSQMNPHFLFNALSSIQNLIRKKDEAGADRYLTQFAGLVRKILHNSEQEFITLEEEMKAIEQYCSLEALRTPFNYEINVADDIDVYNTYIPGMLLQPLIENSILHGLTPKENNRKLSISIKKQGEDLSCEIIDNGIGFNKANLNTQKANFKRKSFGLFLVKQRLQLLLNQPEKEFLKISDRSDSSNETGTIVKLIVPTEK